MKIKKDCRVPESSLANVKSEYLTWGIIEEAWNAYAACPETQLATLFKRFTPGQRAFVALNQLEAEVNNGGIHQYLWNYTGDLFQEALTGLDLVGATAHARLLKKVAQLFSDPKTLRNRRRRQKALEKIQTEDLERLFDHPFDTLEQRKRTCLQSLRLAYFKRHREEFILPRGQSEEQIPLPEPGARDYRVLVKNVVNLRGEKLHWALIQRLWDDYWEPLKRGKQEMLDFLPALSAGQRALIAIDILNKAVVQLDGFKHFLGVQIGADVLKTEVLAGFELLGAAAYADVFGQALAAADDLPDLNRRTTDQSMSLRAARKGSDEVAIQAAREVYRAAVEDKRRREEEVDAQLQRLSDEYKILLESKVHKIEPFIEAYFDAHPDQFLRGFQSDDGRSKANRPSQTPRTRHT